MRRNTPAYAGKTLIPRLRIASAQKHPRVCGEDYGMLFAIVPALETPPRMRGRRFRGCLFRYSRGNTPAYAGKTPREGTRAGTLQKHPRVCGEDLSSVLRWRLYQETPPRMRGRRAVVYSILCACRNTPAYAGKTSQSRTSTSCGQKHPRVCGEDQGLRPRPEPVSKTPPRMRGRPEDKSEKDTRARNTPAYAGKTRRMNDNLAGSWKHPRVCGEDPLINIIPKSSLETPPRMRGRQAGGVTAFFVGGNTPAYAGKTRPDFQKRQGVRKHPRVCGEDRQL